MALPEQWNAPELGERKKSLIQHQLGKSLGIFRLNGRRLQGSRRVFERRCRLLQALFLGGQALLKRLEHLHKLLCQA